MEEIKLPKNARVYSQTEFNKAIYKLNKYNLTDLWIVSCILSSLDYFGSLESQFSYFFPLLNSEKISMFDKAILASSARNSKTNALTSKDLPSVLNILINAAYTDELSDESIDINDRLLHFMSKKANSQFQYQNFNFKTHIARAYALYEYFPNQYREQLRKKHKKNFVDIPVIFKETYGITIREYLLSVFVLWGFYSFRFNNLLMLKGEIKLEIDNKRTTGKNVTQLQSKLLLKLIDASINIRKEFIFTPDNILPKGTSFINKEIIIQFLKIASRSSKDLTYLTYKEPYRKGEIVNRLCPLERFPIVEVTKNTYTIPNFRYFDVSLINVIHFTFQDMFPQNQFNDTFGSVFEFYVNDYVKSRLKNVIILEEKRYKKSKNYIDGPDLTVIDELNDSLVLIEIKSKNIRHEIKLSPISNLFISDLDRPFKALEKLPSKLSDLYFGYKEYSEWQNEINKITSDNTFLLVLIGQGIYFMPEIINMLRQQDSKHFLNNFPYKFGMMRIENFELALELVYEGKAKFYKLLTSYWESSIKEGNKEHSAEQFGGLYPDLKDMYLNRYFEMIFDDLKSNK